MADTTALARPDLLTAADRCDRCQARAWVRVTITGMPLLFCGHHYQTHATSLQHYQVEDFREHLPAAAP